MKAIVKNDLYILLSTAKAFLIVVVIICGMNLYNDNPEFAITFTGILCTTMITSTFAVDDSVQWTRYAMAMPIKRSTYPKAKFVTLLILEVGGVVISTVAAMVVAAVRQSLNANTITKLLIIACVFALLFYMVGSITIVLLLKFGVEKARLLTFAAVLLPVGVVFGGYKLLQAVGVEFTEELTKRFVLCSPLLALVVIAVCLFLSIKIFEKKEL